MPRILKRLSAVAEVFPLFLERSHPLQYRFGSAGASSFEECSQTPAEPGFTPLCL